MNAPELYEIRIAGHLSDSRAGRFEGLSMVPKPEGETALTGELDQAALHGVLMGIRDLGLKLISINRVEASDPRVDNFSNLSDYWRES